MKKILLPLIVVLLLVPVTFGAELDNWHTEINLNPDRTADFLVRFEYNDSVSRSDYFARSDIRNLEVTADGERVDCDLDKKSLGTSIVCKDINSKNVTYQFSTLNTVDLEGEFFEFNYRIPFSRITNEFSTLVKLPVGHTIVSEAELEGTGLEPFEPEYGVKGSDGRHILINWEKTKPQLGERLDLSVIYERSSLPGLDLILPLTIAVILAMIAIFLFFRRGKSKIEDMLPVLTDQERKVMKMLLKEKREMKQKEIVKELDVSKSKVSRIIKDLKERGLIEVRKKGRTNRIKVKEEKE